MGRPEYKLHVPDGMGRLDVVTPDNPEMEYVHMEYLRMKAGESQTIGFPDREFGVLLMGGNFTVDYDGKTEKIVGRKDSFSGLPHCVYCPAGKEIKITADSDFEAALYGTPAEPKGDVAFVYPEDINVLDIGENEWHINGFYVLDSSFPAQKLIIGETHIPVGHWCSVPPHSHDTDEPGKQSKLEEIYLFKFKPQQGFGFQGLYTDDRSLDEGYIIRGDDVILVPRGYHPNVAGPGYEMRMFWGMGAINRDYIPWEDPDHKWIGQTGGGKSVADMDW